MAAPRSAGITAGSPPTKPATNECRWITSGCNSRTSAAQLTDGARRNVQGLERTMDQSWKVTPSASGPKLGSEDMNIHAPVHLRRCELAKQ